MWGGGGGQCVCTSQSLLSNYVFMKGFVKSIVLLRGRGGNCPFYFLR